MSLLHHTQLGYKPFHYPWAYDSWLMQQKIHWLPEEVTMGDDVREWASKLSEAERHLLTHIFRFFVQSDISVNDCYMNHYSRIFQPTEIKMMLAAFSAMETVHIAAYAHLIDTLGLPEVEYSTFMNYKEMRDKYDYMQSFNVDSKFEIARTLAGFGAFTEGLQLFSTFAILLNFPRHGKLKGMGQIITWSVRDESLHLQSIIRLFHAFVEENPEIWTPELRAAIYDIAKNVVTHEDAFITLAFEHGALENLAANDVRRYIRYTADKRLTQLHMRPLFGEKVNPLPWLDTMLNGVEFTNFFENRPTEYSKATLTGTWDDAWSLHDNEHHP